MWPFSLFKKIANDPAIGETRGDYIGCYLFGVETPGANNASYHSLAIAVEDLTADCQQFFSDFLRDVPDAPAAEREAVQDFLQQLPQRLNAHLALPRHVANAQPLLVLGEQHVFLRNGMRARKKEAGRYLE
jgi:hypothetical protein